MNVVIEVIKYCIPAILVGLGFYYAYSSFFRGQYILKQQEINATTAAQNRQSQIQAYERLMLLCERINPYQMRLRLEVPGMTAQSLAQSMTIAIAQEVDHNVSQQLYVSDTLWQIIDQTKVQTQDCVLNALKQVGASASTDDLMGAIDKILFTLKRLPTDTAKIAIKQEAGLVVS